MALLSPFLHENAHSRFRAAPAYSFSVVGHRFDTGIDPVGPGPAAVAALPLRTGAKVRAAPTRSSRACAHVMLWAAR
jgi:hypothetical protein